MKGMGLFLGGKVMDSNKGSTLLAVLVAFLIIILVLMNLLEIAGIERKMSVNNTALLQARQAVDGGVAWACEQTYDVLAEGLNVKALPVNPVNASSTPVVIGASAYQASFRILGAGVKLIQADGGSCTYEFGCEGSCRGATQNASVRVKYRFIELTHDEAGAEVFDRRVFADHGRIMNYQPLNTESSL